MPSPLYAISPIDGRYHSKTDKLSKYFSEYALIHYRIGVEVYYFKQLLPYIFPDINFDFKTIDLVMENFSIADAERVKELEKVTNHDVKAVEYFLKDAIKGSSLEPYSEYIHFGLTSQDINNRKNFAASGVTENYTLCC